MSADAPVGPAVLINHVGQGTVVTFACSPDAATASEWPVVEARKCWRNAVRYLHRNPRVRVEAPQSVESVVTDDPATRTLRIHLIAYQAPPQTMSSSARHLPALIEDCRCIGLAWSRPTVASGARALNPTTVLKTSGRRVEAPVNDIHEVLLLSY